VAVAVSTIGDGVGTGVEAGALDVDVGEPPQAAATRPRMSAPTSVPQRVLLGIFPLLR
jgi:hypothetical protein